MERGLIYHLALAADWEAAVPAGEYRVSTIGHSIDEVGFIHCSYAEQVATTASTYYGGRDDVLVLSVDPSLVAAEVRVEDGFPHLYGPLPVPAVVEIRPLVR